MPLLRRCCCCSVKVASLVLGVLVFLASIYRAANWGWTAGSSAARNEIDLQNQLESYYDYNIYATTDDLRRYEDLTFYLGLVGALRSLITVITTLLLLIGVGKANPKLILPSIVWTPIDILIAIISVAVFCSLVSAKLIFLTIPTVAVAIVSSIIMIIFLVVVISHYQELRDNAQYSGPDKMEM